MNDEAQESQEPRSDLLRQLIADFQTDRTFQSVHFALKDATPPATPYGLLASLQIQPSALSDKAKEALGAIDELAANSDDSAWEDFNWRLSAFMSLQDIFDSPLMQSVTPQVLFEQYYFYFESRVLLAESVLAALNGLYAASASLLRPFLEFTLLQNYYYRLTNRENSYRSLLEYFETRRHPSWNTVLRRALPEDSFAKPVRARAKAHLDGLSQSSAHPYHPDSSAIQHRTAVGCHSLEGLFFWHATSMVLDSVLWVYYTNFPLLFHPVDLLRKFGYNGPMGILIDTNTFEYVRRSLTGKDFETFRRYSSEQEITKATLVY